jgi:hypothetical protein
MAGVTRAIGFGLVLAASAALLGPSPTGAGSASALSPPVVAVGDAARVRATRRALAFLRRTSLDASQFREYGDDLLWCFFSVANTASDRELARAALAIGRERAREWRRLHRVLPRDPAADELADLVSGAFAADLFGARDERFKQQLRVAARRFTARDYLDFDPAVGAPRSTGTQSRYDVFLRALINSYFGDAAGIRLGASHREVMRWLPGMRPYPSSGSDSFDAFYAVTHVVYTLNGYGERRISPRLLPQEVALLKRGLALSIAERDPERVGEGLDSLRAFGYDRSEPLIARGVAYLIASQRPDGSWAGEPDDVYTQYHSAWTGLDGLRDFRFRSEIEHL